MAFDVDTFINYAFYGNLIGHTKDTVLNCYRMYCKLFNVNVDLTESELLGLCGNATQSTLLNGEFTKLDTIIAK